MTYCIAIKLNAGLVFLSDSRTNAGLDQINSFRKMMIYEKTGERFMALLSAGNLSISQSVRELLQTMSIRDDTTGEVLTIWNARSMFDAARVLGAAVRHVHDRDGAALKRSGVDFNVSMLFGGQIKGEGLRLFQVYSAGNFIEATAETPYFQIGEAKYGKPVLDRTLKHADSINFALKVGCLAFDSTRISAAGVDFPLDVVVYSKGSFNLVEHRFEQSDLAHISTWWQERLRESVHALPSEWIDAIAAKLSPSSRKLIKKEE